jgi:hypothetical protein
MLPTIALLASLAAAPANGVFIPTIDGPWWQVAGDPDLCEYTSPNQQPVDFAVWQAADGTWQLWSCIRNTKCGGHTRLFHRWEGKSLTDSDWEPKGVAMMSDPELGEPLGGLQAPHVVLWQGQYWMAYGDWDGICFATSDDGKEFERVVQPNGETMAFTEGPGVNTRDAMLLHTGGLWHCYYTAFPNGRGYGYCRTSPDLKSWSNSSIVAYGGWAGNNPYSVECPHTVEVEKGDYYFFRTQRYGEDAQTTVFRSANPLNFGIDDDTYFVCALPVAAPEIIHHDGQYYMASLLPSLKGIRIARMNWIRTKTAGRPVFDFGDANARAQWRVVEGELDPIFTQSTRQSFNPPMDWFIGTAETDGTAFNGARTCTIESPAFTLDPVPYTLYLSGGGNGDTVYVAIVDADSGGELARFTGRYSNAFEPRMFVAIHDAGTRAFLRIVDNGREDWGHINFGGIYIHDENE